MALKRRLTRKIIEEQIGAANVFEYYFGPFDCDTSYHSFFRRDSEKSSHFFHTEKGNLIYKDFGTGERWDCISFAMKIFDLEYPQALERIAIDFGLIPGERSSPREAIIKKYERPTRKEKVIRVGAVRFNRRHLAYWGQYGITEEELRANHVHAVNTLYINENCIVTKPDGLRFAYEIEDDKGKQYLKIYSPLDKEYKWVSNAPLNVAFGINELPIASDTLIITKGLKDCIILKKFFSDVIATQNESLEALTKETVNALCSVYKKVYIWYDLDRPGIKAYNQYKKTYGKHIKPLYFKLPKDNIWQSLSRAKKLGIKDPSDFVAKYGLEKFKGYLQHIKLL